MNLSAKYRVGLRKLFGPSTPKMKYFWGPSVLALANLFKLASSLRTVLGLKNLLESLSLYFADRFMKRFLFFLLLAGCGPSSLADLRWEGEAETRRLAVELRAIENKEELQRA